MKDGVKYVSISGASHFCVKTWESILNCRLHGIETSTPFEISSPNKT